MSLDPTEHDVHYCLQETPNTVFLTVTRRACSQLNTWAMESLFHGRDPLVVLPTDPESNLANYRGSKLVREDPLQQPIHLGMRVVLTKNLNKDIGFVNGMRATVEDVLQHGVVVRTDQGRRITIHAWTSPAGVVHFPMRLGYASTLHKVQGATLPHITLWLDIAGMPAAAYVALSRVRHDADWRFLGDPYVHHFTPAKF